MTLLSAHLSMTVNKEKRKENVGFSFGSFFSRCSKDDHQLRIIMAKTACGSPCLMVWLTSWRRTLISMVGEKWATMKERKKKMLLPNHLTAGFLKTRSLNFMSYGKVIGKREYKERQIIKMKTI